ncbi:sensor histidine kinase [Clostridium sp.]|uniref:sensor histidine kinase n=1 Tax=Clostridium sp. TaxID=1506 RepID=UPI00262F17F6|nr:sensor histidine kinase [Clostridium sp.]
MKKTEFFKVIISYFRLHIKEFILLCLFSLISSTVFWLYNLSVEPVLYALSLSLTIACLFFIIDFFKYYKLHKLLCKLKETVKFNIGDLPISTDIIQQDYNDLITIIHKDKINIAYNADMSRTDLMDYYTLWAHQIKTPIAAMSLLLQSQDNEENRELSMELFKIEEYVEFALQYLRLESMSSDLLLKKYSLDDIVKQVVRKYAKIFIRKKINLNFTELNCNVLTDEKWLVFVIEQLISNALKYTPNGTISIYLDKTSEKTLVIEDTGIGIQAEDLPRVFEKGFTGYNGRSDKKSTGIGLYLCKQILNKLTHTITMESQVGKGSKVIINLTTIEIYIE